MYGSSITYCPTWDFLVANTGSSDLGYNPTSPQKNRLTIVKGSSDPQDCTIDNCRTKRAVNPGGSFDNRVYIDATGVPRGVPDEFEARNQIAAGLVFFPGGSQ